MNISTNIILRSFFYFLILFFNISVFFAFPHHIGNIFYFITLCLLINFLLYYSLNRSKYFFNIFISVFILLGYGIKYTFSLIFFSKELFYKFSNPFEAEGGFLRNLSEQLFRQNNCNNMSNNSIDYNNLEMHFFNLKCSNIDEIVYDPVIYDRGLLFSIIGISSILISMIAFENLTKNYKLIRYNFFLTTSKLYENIRYILIILIVFLVANITYFNLEYNIYQKGMLSNQIFLLILLKPLITWLLKFGLTSIICNLLFLEHIRKSKYFNILLISSFFEPFFSSISMMSRGFIFNTSSIMLAYLKFLKKINIFYFLLLISSVFFLLFISVKETQNLRKKHFYNNNQEHLSNNKNPEKLSGNFMLFYSNNKSENISHEKNSINDLTPFFGNSIKSENANFIAQVLIERWVGLEEVILTVNSNKIGWNFFLESLTEKQSNKKISLFDKEIYGEYLETDRTENNFTSIPGIIAYASFSNNKMFVFFFISFVTFFCLIIEFLTLRISFNNPFLAALIGQICAFRIIHFGVYPIETYKILLGICLTLIISFYFTKVFFVKNS